MKKKVTSTDIAHAAGVSQSTVSMILNKKYDVSFAKETVEKVENAAKELGYVPPKRKTRKGTKRDFIDMYFLLQHYTLDDILKFYAEKYPENSVFRGLMSLSYFEDAEDELMPKMFSNIQWDDMKQFILDKVATIR